MLTQAQNKIIRDLHKEIKFIAIPMAVVDYETGEDADRFGTRDLIHVRSYNLTVLSLNNEAERRIAEFNKG